MGWAEGCWSRQSALEKGIENITSCFDRGLRETLSCKRPTPQQHEERLQQTRQPRTCEDVKLTSLRAVCWTQRE